MKIEKITAISLSKGDSIYISGSNIHIQKLHLGFGWKVLSPNERPMHIGIFCFMLTQKNVVPRASGIIFYNNLQSICGSVTHLGSRADAGFYGDAEAVKVDLPAVPQNIMRMRLVASIFAAEEREQNFTMVKGLYVRMVNDGSGDEVVRFDADSADTKSTLIEMGDIFRFKGEWCFKASGQGYQKFFDVFPRLLGIKNNLTASW